MAALAALLAVAAPPDARAAPARTGACVRVVDDLAVVRAGDLVACQEPPPPLALAALREEVVAFQVIVQAGDAPLADVRVEVTFDDAGAADAGLGIERFVEHYVTVRERSRGGRDAAESLGWLPAARPDDAATLGEVPDALIPVALAPAWRPYPLAVPARHSAAIWVDVSVAALARPGRYPGVIVVSGADAVETRVRFSLDVAAARLPYRAVSVLASYDPAMLDERLLPSAAGEEDAARRQLWQLLHAHGVDTLASLTRREDAAAVAGALDGSWFDESAGYRGPGARVPPAAVSLGAYGALGEPEPGKRPLVAALAAAVPATIADVFLYAVDEDCASPRGPGWRRVLADGPPLPRPVLVAHTCSDAVAEQDVDLTLVAADSWDARSVAAARARGRRVWVYNGRLPHAATLLLDAPPSAAAALGWIAASHDVDRWFLWASTFWADDNRGGHGAIDPFETAASFHNQEGDVALLDGMYVYPGTQRPPFAAHSVGAPGVLPSMRLKRLRRGLEDAGYLALVAAGEPDAAAAISVLALPLALDELGDDARRGWSDDGAAFARARELLRARIPPGATLDESAARAALHQLALRRRFDGQLPRPTRWRPALVLGGVAALVLALVLFVRRRRVSRS